MTKTAVVKEKAQGLAPLSLKNAPSAIEAEFPVGRLSAEAYKERKAGPGQTLTALRRTEIDGESSATSRAFKCEGI
jgi:hypothetical protein